MKALLPKLLPEAEGRSANWGDTRRCLWEIRHVLSLEGSREAMPSQIRQAHEIRALIPRRFSKSSSWNPAILDDPDAAEGIAKVWELACRNAEANQRRNGPTAEDVRAALLSR